MTTYREGLLAAEGVCKAVFDQFYARWKNYRIDYDDGASDAAAICLATIHRLVEQEDQTNKHLRAGSKANEGDSEGQAESGSRTAGSIPATEAIQRGAAAQELPASAVSAASVGAQKSGASLGCEAPDAQQPAQSAPHQNPAGQRVREPDTTANGAEGEASALPGPDMVSVPRDALEGFIQMMEKQLGKPDRGDITPARMVKLARAMLAAGSAK